MVRLCKSSFVKFSIFCRKRKITHSSSSSVITSTPENKQPPNKRQRKTDYTPFVVLSTNSGKRNQSSEKKVLDKERRKELFTSDSSGDESGINEAEPPFIEVKKETSAINEEEYEYDDDITSPEPNVSCVEILVRFI